MGKLSVVINTLNEEKNLPKALSSVKNIANEIIVVDMHSDDKTQEVAKKSGAKLFTHKRTYYVEPARNFAISKARGEWILILDADEEVPSSLAKMLKKLVKAAKADYYRLPRKNIIFGKWLKHSRWWPDYNIRFFKKGKVSWNEVIHAAPMTVGKGEDLDAKENYALIHNHYETVDQYLLRMNRYTTEHAKIVKKEGYKFKWQDLIKKPSSEFLSRFYFAKGYNDGIHGLAMSLLQAFSELVLYLKIWQMEKFYKEDLKTKDVNEIIKEVERQMHYWQADSMVAQGGGLIQRIKRKLMLP